MTIQKKAIEAWHQYQVEQMLAGQEMAKRRIAPEFEGWYGEPAERVEGFTHNCADIYCDGLHLRGLIDSTGGQLLISVFMPCPKCREEVQSKCFTQLWELGRQLEEFQPDAKWHICD